MFSFLNSDTLKLGGSFILGAILSGVLFYNLGLWNGEDIGEAKANAKSIEATNQAIGEVTKDAENASIARRVCIANNGVYSFGTNKCEQK